MMRARPEGQGAGYGGGIIDVAEQLSLVTSQVSAPAGLTYTVDLSKGLTEPCDPFRAAYFFGAEMNTPDANNWNCLPDIVEPANIFDLSSITSYHEVAVSVIRLYDLPAGQSYTVKYDWYRTEGDELIFSFSYTIADPADYGHEFWASAYVYSYIGYVPWEIWDDGEYYVLISLEYGGVSEETRLDFTIEGLRREWTEGRTYPVRLNIVNLSTDPLGTPINATLNIGIEAKTPSVPVIVPQVSSEAFLPAEERVFDYIAAVPEDIVSEDGYITAWVSNPAGQSVALAQRGILLLRSVLPLSLSYYDTQWHSFMPDDVNPVVAENPNTWVSVRLMRCTPGKHYVLVVITPRGGFSTSLVAEDTSPTLTVQTPTGTVGSEIWTLQLYDTYENSYMFLKMSYDMIVQAV